jgi:hypothetical protein
MTTITLGLLVILPMQVESNSAGSFTMTTLQGVTPSAAA